MNPNRLIAAGALIAGTLIGHAFSTSGAAAVEPPTDCPADEVLSGGTCIPNPCLLSEVFVNGICVATIPTTSRPLAQSPISSIPAPPVESTTATSTTLPPVVEVAPPQLPNDPVSDPRVSGWVVPATQLIPPIAITAPTTVEPSRGCGA